MRKKARSVVDPWMNEGGQLCSSKVNCWLGVAIIGSQYEVIVCFATCSLGWGRFLHLPFPFPLNCTFSLGSCLESEQLLSSEKGSHVTPFTPQPLQSSGLCCEKSYSRSLCYSYEKQSESESWIGRAGDRCLQCLNFWGIIPRTLFNHLSKPRVVLYVTGDSSASSS